MKLNSAKVKAFTKDLEKAYYMPVYVNPTLLVFMADTDNPSLILTETKLVILPGDSRPFTKPLLKAINKLSTKYKVIEAISHYEYACDVFVEFKRDGIRLKHSWSGYDYDDEPSGPLELEL